MEYPHFRGADCNNIPPGIKTAPWAISEGVLCNGSPRITCGGLFCLWRFFADLWHGATAPALTRKGAVGKSCHCLVWDCAVCWSQIRSAECFAAPYLCHEPKPNISRALGSLDLIYRRLDLRDPGLSSCVVVIYVWVEGSAPCHCLKRRKVSPAGDVLFLVAFIGWIVLQGIQLFRPSEISRSKYMNDTCCISLKLFLLRISLNISLGIDETAFLVLYCSLRDRPSFTWILCGNFILADFGLSLNPFSYFVQYLL